MSEDQKLQLSVEPDGFGFYYGSVWRNGDHVRIDVLPPEPLWRGDIKLAEAKPDPKAWTLYIDGEVFARVERREDVQAALEGPPRPSTARAGLVARVVGLFR